MVFEPEKLSAAGSLNAQAVRQLLTMIENCQQVTLTRVPETGQVRCATADPYSVAEGSLFTAISRCLKQVGTDAKAGK